MFTDICKSTNLVEAIGDDAWEDLLRWHDQTLRALFVEHSGEEVDSSRWPRLADYAKRMHARPSFKRLIEEEESGFAAM